MKPARVSDSGEHQKSEDRYRERWRWDRVTWGCHCVDCQPGGCPFRVYSRNGNIVREEQAGHFPTIEPGVPDMNPMGCQKGVAWSRQHYDEERLLHPLKRAGRRGDGNWERISWDQAFSEVADGILDAVCDQGAGSLYHIGTPGEGGLQPWLWNSFFGQLGFQVTDLQAEINACSPGIYTTFGKFDPASGMDDCFKSELILIWQGNPIYTNMTGYHFVQEARYNGAQVVTISPDVSSSTVHADYHVPLEIGTDAAFANAMCQVILEEGLANLDFVRSQTDLPLLVRMDDEHLLRARDVTAGSTEQFYWLDEHTGQVLGAPRDTLRLGAVRPALEGTARVELSDGHSVEVRPVMARLRTLLNQKYTPERIQGICGIHPDTTRKIARMVAAKRTRILMGLNAGKYYHGDLMERSLSLLLGLTGNWGRSGAGLRSRSVGLDVRTSGQFMPPIFFWYHHCGYAQVWNRAKYNDPGMKRSFDEYLQEACVRGGWSGLDESARQPEPRFLIEVGGNLLGRQRGGARMLLEHLWPKLRTIVSVDCCMNTTALHADYVLPAAQHYEKTAPPCASPMHMHVVLHEKAQEPRGESRSEWQMIQGLAQALERRAKERKIEPWARQNGAPVALEGLWKRLTKDGALASDDALIDEIVRDSARIGTLPPDTNLETFRRHGAIRAINGGRSAMMRCQPSPLEPDRTHTPWCNHVERFEPYPTLSRRASFYIDHDWYLEAEEQLPVYKPNPVQGGDQPLQLTSGHPRWSVHSVNQTSPMLLTTQRGSPVICMNPTDMAPRGLQDDDRVRVFNALAEIRMHVRRSPGIRPGQVNICNGYEPFQFERWQGPEHLEPGMVKWLHLAGGYGHLQHRGLHWRPYPVDRAIRVDVERA